ncbi:DUF3405 domain-containing protein [Azospirillum brasilense]|uniref:DUF3405 domain-containing protein n=1 Tax=Azospirillum brasilense TaxID=192 RepID=UPI000E690A12|nr:DUF3405 domain-containing protein [Azospirillum brasilense]NUB28520.1 DUF3405 domain-containing protein [Azospirillum brasilense]NUB35687.1 DUF3405 domain-containing protein [Azospirillum brasilense]RIV96720.1 DUF3405 domain-containing protein [Azospirillum brasilense]
MTSGSPTIKAKKTALVLFSHIINPSIERLLADLSAVSCLNFDFWMTGYFGGNSKAAINPPSPWEFYETNEETIRALPYPNKITSVNDWETLRRNVDLPLLAFFRENSEYDNYWFIEYDVRYSGKWREFFEEFTNTDADLVCAHLTKRTSGDQWMFWGSLASPDCAEENHIRGFLPLTRASNRLMSCINEAYINGWSGHPESTWPTIAKANDFSLEAIGGKGSFTPKNRQGKYYQSAYFESGVFLSTFAAWPAYSASNNFERGHIRNYENLLWHPVK